MFKTEFYEAAVKQGFYGLETGGLFGKKDNVRKYWEDMFIKLSVRSPLAALLERRGRVRVMDLGCGSGEGVELLTHVPVETRTSPRDRTFVLAPEELACYAGVDISPAMVEQGRRNYPDRPGVRFLQADLGDGLPLADEEPFDLYFSSYSSLSHLTAAELADLTRQIFRHARPPAYLVYDLFGRFSPEWPCYWTKTCDQPLPYNMAYLLPPDQRRPEQIESFPVTFWGAAELERLVADAARDTGRQAVIREMKDRSILVGRHMETGLFNGSPRRMRSAVNCLFERDHHGAPCDLTADLAFLEGAPTASPEARDRLRSTLADWTTVVGCHQALADGKADLVRTLIETSRPELSEELKMLAWVFRNASRFPVMDFWASVMGPQVACVLRNLEYGLPAGLGCGHGLLAVVEIGE